ncbi:uncharacterized protein BJX67DRAFT_296906 [Aspergillus lucknowensis]|uniref:Uncharacterized protein n=1 Tax=Aspergillus lucknowensis TaxID=176173 RepID=A0ABR4LFZ5_9EURO
MEMICSLLNHGKTSQACVSSPRRPSVHPGLPRQTPNAEPRCRMAAQARIQARAFLHSSASSRPSHQLWGNCIHIFQNWRASCTCPWPWALKRVSSYSHSQFLGPTLCPIIGSAERQPRINFSAMIVAFRLRNSTRQETARTHPDNLSARSTQAAKPSARCARLSVRANPSGLWLRDWQTKATHEF